MDCNHFEKLLESLERDAPMVANLRAAALQHAESCGDCRARLAAARLLRLELQALASEDEKLQTPARVKENLLSAFREQGPRPARLGSRLSWAVVAAAVVLAGWLLVEQPWRNTGSPVAPRIQVAKSASLPQLGPVAPKVRAENKIAVTKRVRRPPRPRGMRTSADTADDFVALSSGGSWYPMGDGMVVRVQVPRSAPALVGLPISSGDVSGTVTADVVLGEDGVARAIRFVQPSEGKSRNQDFDFTQN